MNNTIRGNLDWLGYREVPNFPQKLNILEHLLLYFFVLKRKEMKLFAALQLFKWFECFLLKVDITKIINMTVSIDILNLCIYRKNWTLINVRMFSEIWMVRIPLTQTNISTSFFFTHFDRLRFQVQIEMKQTPFTKMNTEHTGVFTYQPNI